METCPTCQNELFGSEGKFVCMKCQKFYTKDDLSSKQLRWYEEICNNSSLWFEDGFTNYPSVISHEYWRLFDLFRTGQIYGALLQFKDVLEVLIKFPTLIATSYIYNKNARNDVENRLLVNLLEKPLTLGDWLKIAREMSKKVKLSDELHTLLSKVVDVFDHNGFVHWRNETIGHGALSYKIDEDHKKFLKDSLKALKKYLEESEELHSQLKFQIQLEHESLLLYGKDHARNLNLSSGELFVEINNQKQKLYPYLLFEQEGIYFFDSYFLNKKKTSLLNYPDGKKLNAHWKINNEIQNIYQSLYKEGYFSNIKNNGSVEGNSYAIEDERVLKKLQEVDDFQKPAYLEEWIKTSMNKHSKGVFLLQMERGMGKTTFCRSIDEQSIHRIKIPGFTIRSYYINSSYAFKVKHFLTTINDLLKQDKNEQMAIRLHQHISEEVKNKKEAFANLLKEYYEEHQNYPQYFGQEGLLLILDGLDEIPATEGASIYDFIPEPEMLPDHVYLLLTSRTNEELSEYNLSRIKALTIDEPMKVTNTDVVHLETLEKYIIANILGEKISSKSMEQIKGSLSIEQKSLIQVLLQHVDHRFLYLKPLKELMMMDETIDLSLIPKGEELFVYYFQKLKQLYGSKFFQRVVELVSILSTCYEPLTLEEIAYLLGDEHPTFTLLAYLSDLRGFLKVERSYRGNLYSISHEQWKNVVMKQYQTCIKDLVNSWIEQCLKVDEEYLENIEWNHVKNDGFVYQFTFIRKYLMDYNLGNCSFSTMAFSQSLQTIATGLLSQPLKVYQQQRAVLLLKEMISIMRDLERQGTFYDKKFLAAALVNLSLGLKQLDTLNDVIDLENEAVLMFLELQEQGKLDHEQMLATAIINRGIALGELGLKKEAIQDYNEAIKILRKVKDPSELARALMGRGIILNEIGASKEALVDYGEAIEIRRGIQAQEQSNEKELVLLLMNRGVTFFGIGLQKEALDDYNEAISILKVLKNEAVPFNQHDLIETLLNRGNTLSVLGLPDEALNDYNHAISLLVKLKEQGELYQEIDLARALLNRGNNWNVLQNRKEALEDYTKSIRMKRELKEKGKLNDESELARALVNRGRTLGLLGSSEGALRDYKEAITLLRDLQGEGKLFHENELAFALYERGNMHRRIDSKLEALEDYHSSLSIMEELQENGKLSNTDKITTILLDRGVLFKEIGEIEKAYSDFTRVISIIQELQRESDSQDENEIAIALMHRGNLLINVNEYREAFLDYNQSIFLMKYLKEQEKLYDVTNLARIYMNRGVILRRTGQINEALDDFNEAIVLMLDLQEQGILFDENALAAGYLNRGLLCADVQFYDVALQDVDRSINLLEQLMNKRPDLIDIYFMHVYVYIQLLHINGQTEEIKKVEIKMSDILKSFKGLGETVHWVNEIKSSIKEDKANIDIFGESIVW